MIEPSRTGDEPSLAHLRVGGVGLARHQLGVALALGCQRIICLSPRVDAELVALQHVAEDGGASFHRIAGPTGLLSLVAAGDEMIALAEGLLAWPEMAIGQLAAGPVVLVQPVEAGLAAGFERLDINHAAGGAMRIPGRLIERLAEMPADCDVFSTLQRIALQAAVPQRLLPPEAHEGGRWLLVAGEAEAHAVEAAWIRLHTSVEGRSTPAMLLARKGVRVFGPALLHAGSSGTVLAIAAVVLDLLGLVLGWFGLVALAMVVFAMAWVLFLSASLFGRVERRSLRLPRPALSPALVYSGLMDMGLLLVMTWNIVPKSGLGLFARAFAPIMLLGLMRLLAQVMDHKNARWLEDRMMLALGLALAAMVGWFGPSIGLLALLVLGLGIVSTGRKPRLSPGHDEPAFGITPA